MVTSNIIVQKNIGFNYIIDKDTDWMNLFRLRFTTSLRKKKGDIQYQQLIFTIHHATTKSNKNLTALILKCHK